ncbi:hypothetical protein BC940DRAFT_302406 [Gongronella butleri]|nr:hypothetical protein BC940DRAFT_302406 [Gongronella butleri]
MSASIDVTAFADPAFDVKNWINQALGPRASIFATPEHDKGSEKDTSGQQDPETRPNDGKDDAKDDEKDAVATSDKAGSIEQDLTMLATKLQLHSEQTSQQITTLTDQVIRSMPRIVYDLKLVAEDAQGAQKALQEVQQQLNKTQPAIDDDDDSLEKLRLLHICKTRMEDSLYALTEAQNWSNLESQVNKALDNIDT